MEKIAFHNGVRYNVVKEGDYHAGDECDDISPEFVSNA